MGVVLLFHDGAQYPQEGARSDGAASAPSPPLNVNLLSYRERVVDLDAEVLYGAFHFRMPK